MAKTIIRQYPGANFPDGLILDLESPINWGANSPAGHFRFAKTLGNALRNRIEGGANALVSTNNSLTVRPASVSVDSGTGLYVPTNLALPCTFVVVFHQTPEGVSQTLAGAPSVTGSDSAGLCVSANGNLAAIARVNSANYSATVAKDGGDRWEMVVATFDNSGPAGTHAIALHRPRTSTKVLTQSATLPANINTTQVCRILGSGSGLNGAVEGALCAYWPGRVLGDGVIGSIYDSAKRSLAASGLEI